MDTNHVVELRDERIYPGEPVLRALLGQAYPAYQAVLDLFARHGLAHEWRYYHDGKTWLCKVQKGSRTIVWMSAWKDYLQAVIYFPEKHIEALYGLDVCEARKEIIRQTRNSGKSKPCIFQIRAADELADFETVMEFKIRAK